MSIDPQMRRLIDCERGSSGNGQTPAAGLLTHAIFGTVMLAALAPGAALIAAATPSPPEEHRARNQASAADTIIVPADAVDQKADSGTSVAAIEKALPATGLKMLDHVGIIDATVDANGCMTAPLAVQYPQSVEHSAAVDALADALRHRGVIVTMISGQVAHALDQASQARIKALRGNFQLSFGEGEGRWLATKADLVRCTKIDVDEQQEAMTPHAPLAAIMSELHQDAIIAVGENRAESKGASWNIIEGALSSDGKDLDAPTSSAEISATLVLKDGSTPWSDEAHASGALRPALEAQAVAKLKAYLEDTLRKMEVYRTAHPDVQKPPADDSEKAMNAIASGELEEANEGSTTGPSGFATLHAAADRLIARLTPVLPKH